MSFVVLRWRSEASAQPLLIDLSAASFQNLSSIEFRIYPYDNSSGIDHFNRIDDIVLRGALASSAQVPEPGTLLLGLGLALVGGTVPVPGCKSSVTALICQSIRKGRASI